jgi:hypothetical protein
MDLTTEVCGMTDLTGSGYGSMMGFYEVNNELRLP